MTASVIYYTSNRENQEFEGKIIYDLAHKTSLPIISVSQKPIKLGKNICVGDVGTSGFNLCRQIQIACREANTDFVISAESDCLYSPEYFTFTPKRLDIPYRNTNIYVIRYKRETFSKKDSSMFAQVVGREFFINRLDDLFGDSSMWNTKEKNFPKERKRKIFDEYEYFWTDSACISFKTGRGMRQHTNTDDTEAYSLPYWGTAKGLRKWAGL